MTRILRAACLVGGVLGMAVATPAAFATLLSPPSQQAPPKGQTPDRGRHTQQDDEVPLFDFDAYFLGTWSFEWDVPEGPLDEAGRIEGSTVYRALEKDVYEAATKANGPGGPFTVKEVIRYRKAEKSLTREVTDSRGFAYSQTGTIGGDLGGFYTIYLESTPFTVNGQSVRLKHTMRLTAPLAHRVSTTVAVDGGAFRNYGTPWFAKVP